MENIVSPVTTVRNNS